MSIENRFELQIARLQTALAKTAPTPRERLANNRNAAAVLVPIVERGGRMHIVFIRRSDQVESHRGQVAFPGGRVEPDDASLLATALREADEEVAIPPRAVRVLGAFPVQSTLTSGIIVAPFAGVIPAGTPMRPSPQEVAEIFEVPLAALNDPRYRGDYEWRRDGGKPARYPAVKYGGQTIWGLTLRITLDLLEMLDG